MESAPNQERETIIEPSEEIFRIQKEALDEIVTLLPMSHVEAVGAMAVPMTGRPELDLLVVSEQIEEDSRIVMDNGYRQGPVIDKTSFLKKMVGDVEVGIQIMSSDSPMIETHRKIIAILREDKDLRERYEEFKRTLSELTRKEYKEKKSAWIAENILTSKKF